MLKSLVQINSGTTDLTWVILSNFPEFDKLKFLDFTSIFLLEYVLIKDSFFFCGDTFGSEVSPELTTRLRHTITSVDGDDSQSTINGFVQNLLARDSMYLRKEIQKNSPDIELEQEIDIEGESVKVNIPMTVGFFWPDA